MARPRKYESQDEAAEAERCKDIERNRRNRKRKRQDELLAGKIAKRYMRLSDKALLSEGRRQQRMQRAAEAAAAEQAANGTSRIEHCDFREWDIKDGSVNLVLTDPPYAAEHLPLYQDLPVHAERWLVDGGWCAVMVGQRHLPAMLAALADGPLEYVWTMGLAHSAGRVNGIQFIKIQNAWKPLVLLRKGKPTLLEWTNDLISYDWTPDDGDHHKWQQDVSPFQKLIRAMTKPEAVVADPFCGSGTTGIAALTTKRSFIGCDQDADAVQIARGRVTEMEQNHRSAVLAS